MTHEKIEATRSVEVLGGVMLLHAGTWLPGLFIDHKTGKAAWALRPDLRKTLEQKTAAAAEAITPAMVQAAQQEQRGTV